MTSVDAVLEHDQRASPADHLQTPKSKEVTAVPPAVAVICTAVQERRRRTHSFNRDTSVYRAD